jgi:putative phosphoesterase
VTLRAVVLADTHLRAASRRRLPARVVQLLEGADVILHAGDVVDAGVLETLQAMAPTYAVLGNNDHTLTGRLPLVADLELDGVRIAMVHDSGPVAGRAARMRRRFPDAALVVFGHSHVPVDIEGLGGQRLFNPGSPTQRRAQPHRTAGIVELADGAICSTEVVVVDD